MIDFRSIVWICRMAQFRHLARANGNQGQAMQTLALALPIGSSRTCALFHQNWPLEFWGRGTRGWGIKMRTVGKERDSDRWKLQSPGSCGTI
jgi:hypothetical protein